MLLLGGVTRQRGAKASADAWGANPKLQLRGGAARLGARSARGGRAKGERARRGRSAYLPVRTPPAPATAREGGVAPFARRSTWGSPRGLHSVCGARARAERQTISTRTRRRSAAERRRGARGGGAPRSRGKKRATTFASRAPPEGGIKTHPRDRGGARLSAGISALSTAPRSHGSRARAQRPDGVIMRKNYTEKSARAPASDWVGWTVISLVRCDEANEVARGPLVGSAPARLRAFSN